MAEDVTRIIPGWRPLVPEAMVSDAEARQRAALIFRLKMVRRDDMTPLFDKLNGRNVVWLGSTR